MKNVSTTAKKAIVIVATFALAFSTINLSNDTKATAAGFTAETPFAMSAFANQWWPSYLNLSGNTATLITVRWPSVGTSLRYNIQVSSTSNFATTLSNTTVTNASAAAYSWSYATKTKTTYYVRVRDANQVTNHWSDTLAVTTP